MNGAWSLHEALSQAFETDARVHLLGEALELSPVTQGLMAIAPERAHLLPAADATLVGLAIGMALGGARPVVELADAAALWAALPQLGGEIGALAAATEFPLSLVLRLPLAPRAPDLDLLDLLPPRIAIAAIGRAGEAGPTLRAALAHGGPVVLIEPLEVLAGTEQVTEEALPLGRARLLREGSQATVLAFGAGVPAALDAADILAHTGIEVEVIDLRTIRPLDEALIGARCRLTGRILTAGAPPSVMAAAARLAFLRLEAPPVAVGADAAAIAAAVRASLSY